MFYLASTRRANIHIRQLGPPSTAPLVPAKYHGSLFGGAIPKDSSHKGTCSQVSQPLSPRTSHYRVSLSRSAEAFVDIIEAPRLTQLHLSAIETREGEDLLSHLLPVIADQYPLLQHLQLAINTIHTPTSSFPADIDTLRPLGHLRNLKHSSLSSAHEDFMLKSGALAELAPSWPELETFELRRNYADIDVSADPDPGLPLIQEIVAFVRHCPLLNTLGISLDATRLSEADINALLTSSPPVVHLTRIRLSIADTPPSDAELMARWLTTPFKDVRVDDAEFDTVRWKPVSDQCRKIQEEHDTRK